MKHRYTAFVTLCVLALAGARVPAASDHANDGFLTVRLVSHTLRVDMFIKRFETIVVQADAPRGKRYELTAVNRAPIYYDLFQSTLAFGDRLPAGRYRLISLVGHAGTMSAQASIADRLPTFEVVAGAVTDLGILVFQDIGDSKALLIPIHDVDTTSTVLRRSFPDAVATFEGHDGPAWDPANGWQPKPIEFGGVSTGLGLIADLLVAGTSDSTPSQAQANWGEVTTLSQGVERVRASTMTLSMPAYASDGSVYFGSTLGQVLRRFPDGKWQQTDTRWLAEISAITVAGDDELLIGTEFGDIYSMHVDGSGLRLVASVPDRGRVVDVKRLPGGTWFVATRTYDQKESEANTRVFQGEALDRLTPEAVNSLTQAGTGTWTQPVRVPASTAMGRAGYYVGVETLESDTFDFQTRTWTKVTKGKPQRILANNAGDVLFSDFPALYSTDQGKTWSALNAPRGLLGLHMFDASNAMTLVPARFRGNAVQIVMVSHDAGKTWAQVDASALPGQPCFGMTWYLDSEKRMFCTFLDRGVYSYVEGGQWQLDRPATRLQSGPAPENE